MEEERKGKGREAAQLYVLPSPLPARARCYLLGLTAGFYCWENHDRGAEQSSFEAIDPV